MRMHIATDIPLSEPSAQFGLITWLSIDVLPDDGSPAQSSPVGHARIARIHVGNAADSNQSIHEALLADSAELATLYDLYFDDGWLEDEFADAVGHDLLYIREIAIDPACARHNIDLALVRRLSDTLGQGCALAVVRYASQDDIDHWTPLGFEVTTPGAAEGYLHLMLGHRTARVGDPDQPGVFKILPNPSPEGVETHH